ncbi:MAG: ABC transporter permease [Gemmatimonadota bacterium]|nr:ABC transporter permease [Gemmatimonadota bacterium]
MPSVAEPEYPFPRALESETPSPASATGSRSGPPALRVIRPRERWRAVDLGELWRYRGVVGYLVRRDLKVRYAQTALGAAWAIFQPVMPMVVFTIVFGHFGKMPSGGAPYALFALAALVPWTYFSAAILGATNSLISHPELITKVYFPRLAIPLAPVIAVLVDFAIGLAVLGGLMLAYGVAPRADAVYLLPLLVLLTVAAATGAGCWLAALNTRYRDVKHVTPTLLQILMYASPIVYPLALLPARYRSAYSLNPMVGVIEGFREVLLGIPMVHPQAIAISCAVSVLLLLSGLFYFRRTERVFADVI